MGLAVAAVAGGFAFDVETGLGWLFFDELDFGAGGGAFELVAEPEAPTVTSGVIFLMVAAEIPALDKSLTEEYGLPAIIFFAVAGPTPGKASRSFWLAALRSTLLAFEAVVTADELLVLLFVWAARAAMDIAPHAPITIKKQSAVRVPSFFIESSSRLTMASLTFRQVH